MTQDRALEILKSGVNVFLTGEPGAGKTHTIGQFAQYLEEKKIRYALTASTGIAASHLNGSTIHSWSGLGIRQHLSKEEIEDMKYNIRVSQRVRGTQVLIIDEISMLDANTLDNVDAIMRSIFSRPTSPFGGVQVVFVGDFFQLPPVSKSGEVRFAFDSNAWMQAAPSVCYLHEQHRQSDPKFLEILAGMRSGTTTEEHKAIITGSVLATKPDTKLFTHNADVDMLNLLELRKLPGDVEQYDMDEGGDPRLSEGLKKRCLSPENLFLKEGAVVMATANNFNEGYVNGSIGKVIKIKPVPVVQFQNGITCEIDPYQWSHFADDNKKVLAWVRQYPLRLAWAITVHKSQGMSLDSAAVDLSATFEYGQGYVALSRVRSLGGLHVEGINDMVFKMHPRVVERDAEFRAESQ